MINQARGVAATALALVMMAPHASALPRNFLPRSEAHHALPGARVLLVQDRECPENDPDCRAEEQETRPAEDAAPAEEPAPDDQPASEETAPTPEQPPVPEASPGDQQVTPLVDDAAPDLPEAAPAPEDAPLEAEPETLPEEPAPEEIAPPAEETETGPASEETPAAEQAPEDAPAAPENVPATPEEVPAAPEAGQVPGEPAEDEMAAPVDEPVAPILDSQKEEQAAPDATGEPGAGQPVEQQQPAEAAPPPASDEEAQQLEQPVEVQSLRAEEGRRIERREERRERHEGSNVLREIGDRVVIELNNQIVVQSDDRDRIGRNASEVYYEELPRGRTRETIVRPNGVQVVTVYDRYGDVVSRSRFTPDGREHVLVYADYRDRGDRRQWRDPGMDLPPLRLSIPAGEYTLDARRVRDERAYYDFLNQPPVEPVRRLYSVDEVRYSARVRDSVRRVDMDTLTFDFGSATISEAAVPQLSGVAHAIGQLLGENPAEMFLIEGHTDAVGTDAANLALSDRRAEAVAMALTNVFDIPPENLVTQGYGERYLKISTQEPERQNRRVVMRRITPLVAPVAGLQ